MSDAISVIQPSEAQALLARGEAIVIDVRPATDWAGGRVPGSRNFPNLAIKARRAEIPTDKTLIVIGANARKSTEAAQAAIAAGFNSICIVDGGFEAWVGAGMPSDTIG